MRVKCKLFVIFFAITLFFSCSDKTKKIIGKSSIDGNITCEEFKEIKEFIKSDKRSYSSVFTSLGAIDNGKLRELISVNANLRTGNLIFEECNERTSDVGLFLENSISMLGYISGASDFQKNILDIYSGLGYQNNVSTYLVNRTLDSKGRVSTSNLGEIISNKDKFVNSGSGISDLNHVLDNVLNNTNENSISILASDFVYSLGGQNLVIVGGITKDLFLRKSKKIKNLSVLLIQLDSQFNGTYYDLRDKPIELENVRRPYYLMIIGSSTMIEKFSQTINVNELQGFINSYYITSNKIEPFHKILLGTEALGRIKIDQDNPYELEISKLENNEMQMAIAVDLSKYPDHSKLLDPSNYRISEGYKVVKIEKINALNNPNKVNPNDWVTLKDSKATHYIVIKNNLFPLKSDMTLSLENKQPSWIGLSSVDNDTNIKNNLQKTFGFSYLVNGISNAFQQINNNDNSFFEIKYKIK